MLRMVKRVGILHARHRDAPVQVEYPSDSQERIQPGIHQPSRPARRFYGPICLDGDACRLGHVVLRQSAPTSFAPNFHREQARGMQKAVPVATLGERITRLRHIKTQTYVPGTSGT